MKEHVLTKKIYYHDTDAGGVVYYAAYWQFMEEGLSEFCAERAIDTAEMFNKGIAFVAVHAEADYKIPARYGDTISIHTRVDSVGNSSIHFSLEIKKTTVACRRKGRLGMHKPGFQNVKGSAAGQGSNLIMS